MIKTNLFGRLCLCGIALLGFAACSDDETTWADVDGAAPAMALEATHLRTEKGNQVTFKGELADKDGIASIHLYCPGLYLDKTIDLISIYGEPKKTYSLDYTHQVNKALEEDSRHTVEITVTDVGGRTTTSEVLVTLDADLQAPIFTTRPADEVTVLIKDPTVLKVKFSVEDNKKLESVRIQMPALDIDETITTFDDPKSFSYNRVIEISEDEETYELTVTATDGEEGHEATFTTLYDVTELPDFDKVYLADVTDPKLLNSDVFGVPILVDHVGSYEYQARYYNATAGTQVCFIPQNTDFSPICFAPDKEDPTKLGDDLEDENRFVLDQAGVYYLFKFNTLTREYSIETYPVSEAVDPIMHMHYGGNDLNTWMDWETADPWWQPFYIGPGGSPSGVTRMEQDKNNPHLYVLDYWELTAGQELSFIISNWHSHGWWGYTEWRTDDQNECNTAVYIGNYFLDNQHFTNNKDYFDWKYSDVPGFDAMKWRNSDDYRKQFVQDIWFKPEVKKSGIYRLELDVHTERAKLVFVK